MASRLDPMSIDNDTGTGVTSAKSVTTPSKKIDPILGRQPDEFFTIGAGRDISSKIEKEQRRSKNPSR
jgi:hypothetical protein